jgi:hypothetical protein
MNLLCYTLPHMIAQHMGSEGNTVYNMQDSAEYWKFKQKEVHDPAKKEVLDYCRKHNYPYYNPYL